MSISLPPTGVKATTRHDLPALRLVYIGEQEAKVLTCSYQSSRSPKVVMSLRPGKIPQKPVHTRSSRCPIALAAMILVVPSLLLDTSKMATSRTSFLSTLSVAG